MDILERLRQCIDSGERARDFDFRHTDLDGADLSRLSADRLDLRDASLRGATLRGARLGSCRCDRANIAESDWSGATLRVCKLDAVRGAGIRLDEARIEDCSAVGADLSHASLRRAQLSETSLSRAVLQKATLDEAHGDGVDFRGADLAGATLVDARLDEADFRGADLRGANLTRGRFRFADFRGALLDDTRFDDADCRGARFDQDVPSTRHGQSASFRTGPATSQPNEAESARTRSFDDLARSAIRDAVAQLPAMFAATDGPAAELLQRTRGAVDALAAGADEAPADWRPWVDRLVALASDVKEPASLNALLAALADAAVAARATPASGGQAAPEIPGPLREAFEALSNASNEPPDAWKPCLEQLLKMTSGEQPLDLDTLLGGIASLATGATSQVNPGKESHGHA